MAGIKKLIYIVWVQYLSSYSALLRQVWNVCQFKKIQESGHIPDEQKLDTDKAILAQFMVDQNPDNRPTAHNVLQKLVQKGLLADPDTKVILKLINQLQNNVNKLEQIVLDKDKEAKS